MGDRREEDLQSELVSFRQNWREELRNDRENELSGGQDSSSGEPAQLTLEERATQLFLEGARYEREGQLNVAVYYYRQAVHLVPDIEFKIAETNFRTGGDESSDEDEDDEVDVSQPSLHLDSKILMDSVADSLSLMNMTGLCSPESEQTTTHISALPTELLSTLFRWVVSKDLDVKSLGKLSRVCKWFYVCARDQEIWKQICLRVWGINCDTVLYNNSWRQMYLERPHVRLDGVYISTNTYVHIGEPAVGHHYKPVHVVEYYKYLRFFADGTVLIYTSADDPQGVVQLLNRPPYRDPCIHKGYYRLSEMNKVSVFYMRVTKPKKDFSNRRGHREKPDVREHHFFMTLILKGSPKRRNTQLLWDEYRLQIKSRKTGDSNESDVPFTSFKPFVFSGVRSYLSCSTGSI